MRNLHTDAARIAETLRQQASAVDAVLMCGDWLARWAVNEWEWPAERTQAEEGARLVAQYRDAVRRLHEI